MLSVVLSLPSPYPMRMKFTHLYCAAALVAITVASPTPGPSPDVGGLECTPQPVLCCSSSGTVHLSSLYCDEFRDENYSIGT